MSFFFLAWSTQRMGRHWRLLMVFFAARNVKTSTSAAKKPIAYDGKLVLLLSLWKSKCFIWPCASTPIRLCDCFCDCRNPRFFSTEAYRYRHTGWENEEIQVLSKYSYSGWKPSVYLRPFHQIICSFQLTRSNWSSRLTCSDSHASAEPCLIPSQYDFTYGISASHLYLSARPPSDKMGCHHQISWVAILPLLPALSPGYFTSVPEWN